MIIHNNSVEPLAAAILAQTIRDYRAGLVYIREKGRINCDIVRFFDDAIEYMNSPTFAILHDIKPGDLMERINNYPGRKMNVPYIIKWRKEGRN